MKNDSKSSGCKDKPQGIVGGKKIAAEKMYCGGGIADNASQQQSYNECGLKLPHLWRQLLNLNFGHGVPAK